MNQLVESTEWNGRAITAFSEQNAKPWIFFGHTLAKHWLAHSILLFLSLLRATPPSAIFG
jgi:hypothetical protein